MIAYQVEDDCVRIIDVFYGGRDFEAFFRRGGAEDERWKARSNVDTAAE